MKILKKLIKKENGSITMTVLAAMLFITTVLVVSYFSISSQGSNQNRKVQQISKQYSVTDGELEERYNQLLRQLDNTSYMKINEIKSLGNIMLSKKTNTTTTDEYGNSITIPAGFKLTEVDEYGNAMTIPENFQKADKTNNVTQGVVIEDKDGNQFVWIPVGDIKYEEDGVIKTKTINLGRYYFNGEGEIYLTKTDGSARRPQNYKSDYTEDETQSQYGNAIAKNINEFISSTKSNMGFYIGRYEARIEGYSGNVSNSNKNNEKSWTGYNGGKLVEKPREQVFNYITQNKASELSIAMYSENENFQSDLINSYAWDTATLFLQNFDNRTDAVKSNTKYNSKYSMQGSLSTEVLKVNGTSKVGTAESEIDRICNVYDMAGNAYEWSTETCNNSSGLCVMRGGIYNYGYTSRVSTSTSITVAALHNSFRPIIYIK